MANEAITEENRQRTWDAWHRWLADENASIASRKERCVQYFARAVQDAYEDGRRAGITEAAQVALSEQMITGEPVNSCTWGGGHNVACYAIYKKLCALLPDTKPEEGEQDGESGDNA